MRFRWHEAGIVVLTLALASAAEARVEVVEWQHPKPGVVSGFRLHVGSSSDSYETVMDVGLPIAPGGGFSQPLPVGDDETVYVAVSAYNPAGSSPLSNEGVLAPPHVPGEGGMLRVEDDETFGGLEKGWTMVDAIDLLGNGQPELVWRDGKSTEHQFWVMDGGSLVGGVPFEVPSKKWQLVGSGDVDGEGSDDLIWWDSKQGRVFIWLKWVGPVGEIELVQGDAEEKWRPVGVGDVDGDGHSDLIWHASKEGFYYVWLLDADGLAGVLQIDAPAEKSSLAGLGDFDGSGTADLLWEGKSSGYFTWLLHGARTLDEGILGLPEKGWELAGIGDFDGDRRDDLLWFKKKEGCQVWLLDGDRVRQEAFLMGVEKDWRVEGVGDFDGDGIADVLLQHGKGLGARIAYIGLAP